MTEAEQLEEIVEAVNDVLGTELLAAYLFGSAVLGGLTPGSDLDVLAVTRRATTRDEKRRLVQRLLALSGNPRHVELTIVAQHEIRPWRYPPVRDFQYGDWWRTEFEAGDLEPWRAPTDPDLASLLTMVLLGGRPLVGPPAAEVFDPVRTARPNGRSIGCRPPTDPSSSGRGRSTSASWRTAAGRRCALTCARSPITSRPRFAPSWRTDYATPRVAHAPAVTVNGASGSRSRQRSRKMA